MAKTGTNEREGIDDNLGDPHAVADPASHVHTIFRDLAKILKHLETQQIATVAQHGSGQPNQGAPVSQYDRVVLPPENYDNSFLLQNQLGAGHVNEQGYHLPGGRLEGLGDDNDAESLSANDVALRVLDEQALREMASLTSASEFVDALMAVMGQRENGPDLIKNSDTTAGENKAQKIALGIATGLGLTSTLGLAATLVYIFGFGVPVKKDSKSSLPKVFDHTKIADSYTKPVTLDLLGNAADGAAPIDKASLKFVEKIDATGPVLVDSLDLGPAGKWTKGNVAGQVVFTPGAKTGGIQTSASFVAFDSSSPPVQSNIARALVIFDPRDTSNRLPEDDAPQVFPVRSENNTAGQKVTVDVLASAQKGVSDIDKSTLTILSGIDNGKTLQVMGEGVWMVVGNTGTISFEPEKNFSFSPRPIRYSVADQMGQRSADAPLTITYSGAGTRPVKPVAKQAIIEYTLGSGGAAPAPVRIKVADHVIKGDDDLDLTQTVFVNTRTPRGFGGNPMPAYENPLIQNAKTIGYRKVRVPGQGTWTIENSGTEIVLTVDAAAKGVPTSVSYSVADTKGRRSSSAYITPLTSTDEIFKATDALNQKTDAQFWGDLDTLVKNTTPTLEEWASIVFSLLKVTKTGVGAASAMLLDVRGDHQIKGAAYIKLFQEWSQGKFSVDGLIAIAKREVTDTSVNLPNTPLATRLLRLSLMGRLYRTYNSEILKATGRGP